MADQDNIASAYKNIADYLKAPKGLCTLVLGPDLAVNQQGVGYKVFFRKLWHDNNNEIAHYFEKENLFSFVDATGRKRNRTRIKDFYNDCGDQVLLEMVSRIRFPFIINVSPDNALNRIYKKKNIAFREGYFTTGSTQQKDDIPYPTKDLPVIYNIFGQVEPDTSLILEHSRLYQTVQELLPDDSLPKALEKFLGESSSFILLGFKFDSWQYQLMCHKLKLRGDSKINLSTPEIDEESIVSMVMKKHFEIDFAKDNPAQAIEKIIEQCKDDPEAIRPKDQNSSFSLFVSYAWADPETPAGAANRETVVNWMEKQSDLAKETTLLFFRDHTDLGYGESIDSFMTRIGKGKTVIRVVSDKYLRSRYCMIEAIRIARYQDEEERIFTIIWEDAKLDMENGYVGYRNYWKEKCQAILEDIEHKLDNDRYDDSVAIYRFLPEFFGNLNDKVNLLVSSKDLAIDPATGTIIIAENRKAEFDAFVNAIIKKIKDN
jgi:SIR2-like domain